MRVGLVGAGKFGAMFLAQARRTPGLHLAGVADLSADRARAALVRTGWEAERVAAASFDEAYMRGSTWVTEDAPALIAAGGLDVVVEATGVPEAGIRHALACIRAGKHVVMVNVEADALAGPIARMRAPGAPGARGWSGVLAGLRRPAGADLRTGGLGARLRLRGGLRGQRHQVPAQLPPVHAGHGVGTLAAPTPRSTGPTT